MAEFSPDKITGRQNPLVTRLSKLSDKKYRDIEGLFRIDGVKLFSEAVTSGVKTEYIFVAESRRSRITDELQNELYEARGKIIEVSDEVLAKLTDESAPQGIVAFAKKFDTAELSVPETDTLCAVYLSSVRDPGNLGTMLRSALAFGVDRVFVSSDCADIYSPKTVRASMGAVFKQSISVVKNDAELVESLSRANCPIYAAALRRDAMRLGSFTLPGKVCFAIGNEGHGLSGEFIDMCTGTVFIPMSDVCESLNAAMAASVIMWEMQRERLVGEKNN